jgi:hypothetical protein
MRNSSIENVIIGSSIITLFCFIIGFTYAVWPSETNRTFFVVICLIGAVSTLALLFSTGLGVLKLLKKQP